MIRPTPSSSRLLSTLRAQSVRASRPSYTPITRRLASTASGPDKRGSWRSFLVRLGLAGGAVYYYNTSPFFADEPALLHVGPDAAAETPLPTLESIVASRAGKRTAPPPVHESNGPPLGSETPPAGDPAALEAEAGQQGAFNPETGEINWDCPCLGGMATGPCGEEFKAAFSCFVYSEQEPKGMECIDKFKGMQECFRAYPDVYGAELEDDEEDGEGAPAVTNGDSVQSEGTKAKDAAGATIASVVDQVEPAVESATNAARKGIEKVEDKVTGDDGGVGIGEVKAFNKK